MNNHDLNEREINIIEVLLLNLTAQVNVPITTLNMAFNPLDRTEENVIFNYQFSWQSSISLEQYDEFKEELTRRITNTIKMCALPEINIAIMENSYLYT